MVWKGVGWYERGVARRLVLAHMPKNNDVVEVLVNTMCQRQTVLEITKNVNTSRLEWAGLGNARCNAVLFAHGHAMDPKHKWTLPAIPSVCSTPTPLLHIDE